MAFENAPDEVAMTMIVFHDDEEEDDDDDDDRMNSSDSIDKINPP